MELNDIQLETYTSFEISLNAKGNAQWVVKSKYPTTQKAGEELSAAINLLRKTLKEKGITEAGKGV